MKEHEAENNGTQKMRIVTNKNDPLKEIVDSEGALILRTGVSTIKEFADIARLFGDLDVDMSCSAGPRIDVGFGIFTSNEAPPNQAIPPHHEMAQCEYPPHYVLFYCDTPPTSGGCTPVIRSTLVARHFRERYPELCKRLQCEGVRYVRTFPNRTDVTSPLGKSWRDTYNVTCRADVEAILLHTGVAWEWLGADVLQTISKPMPIFRQTALGEVLFCAAETSFLHEASNESCLPVDSAHSLSRPKKELLYGNGEPLDEGAKEAFAYIGRYAFAHSTRVPWMQHDVLILNNSVVMHSRDSFVPPRRILVALAGAFQSS